MIIDGEAVAAVTRPPLPCSTPSTCYIWTAMIFARWSISLVGICWPTPWIAAIIIFWNTMKLGEVVTNQKRDGKPLSPDLLAHVSPLGWEHINLTGEYRWPKP